MRTTPRAYATSPTIILIRRTPVDAPCRGLGAHAGVLRPSKAAVVHRDAVVIVNQAGSAVRLHQIMVAAPCKPFSRFALELDSVIEPAMIKETLQFLDGGMRGFYCRLDGRETLISVGDSVYLV